MRKLYGLVLAGGRGRRLGRDKGLINWHGKQQRYYMADLLAEYCQSVYISCRADQEAEITQAGYTALVDKSGPEGPYGALITALQTETDADTDAGWLVVACDLPFFDGEAAKTLIAQRNASKLATAMMNPDEALPEPLAAIWEPASLEALLRLHDEKNLDCPRKALIRMEKNVKLVEPKSKANIFNVNTASDAAQAQAIIGA